MLEQSPDHTEQPTELARLWIVVEPLSIADSLSIIDPLSIERPTAAAEIVIETRPLPSLDVAP